MFGWRPGRLLLGWALGILTALGVVTLTGGWYEYRYLSTVPGSGSPARRTSDANSACQVDKAAAHGADYAMVPDQPDPCFPRRPRIRPSPWADGIRVLFGG